MALIFSCSKLSLTTKAAMFILVLMAVATTPGTSTYTAADEMEEGGMEVYSPQDAGQAGAFPVEAGGAGAAGRSNGRKLLQVFNLCGTGTAPVYNCRNILLGLARTPMCCPDSLNVSQRCFDLSTSELHCSNCQTRCTFSQTCCSGACANTFTDPNNCGTCGTKCGNDRSAASSASAATNFS